MKKTILSVVLLFVLVFIAGCVNQGETSNYNNEILSINIKAPTKILPNSDVEISAILKNNGERSIYNVDFLITDTYGLNIVNIDCENGVKLNNGCKFDKIESGDEIEITYILSLPESYISIKELKVSPDFTITYDYSGQTIWSIPIVKKKFIFESIPSEKLVQTPGPVKVYLRKNLEDGDENNEINEDSIFSLFVEVYDSKGSKMTIDKNNFWIKLTNLEVYSSDGRKSCRFSEDSNKLIPSEDIILPQVEPLYCILKAKKIQKGWDMGIVEVNFNYQYKIIQKVQMNIITNLS